MKMIEETSKSATKNDICYFRDFWIVISIWASEQKRVRLEKYHDLFIDPLFPGGTLFTMIFYNSLL